MSKISAIIAIACALPSLASASSWPEYDEFMQKHLIGGALVEDSGQISARNMARGMFLAVANDDKSTFNAMYQVWCRALCDNDVQKNLAAAAYPIAEQHFTDSQAVMLASYAFIEASELWNEKSVYQSAVSQLGMLYDNCTAFVESAGRVLLAGNSRPDSLVDVAPSAIPPFAVYGICKAEPRLSPVIFASFQTMVRGDGDGFASDTVQLNANGDVVFTEGKGASVIGSDFLLYLGISSDADPQKRLLKPLFDSLSLRFKHELSAPDFVDLYSHQLEGEGSLAFDIAMLNMSSDNVRDLLRTRIKNAPLKQYSLSSQLAALIANGIDEKRFMLDAQGCIRIRP